ncbi:MAG: eukaryotic-like serine/threonine-protein kinase, partial [Actinoplanes sp.]|nr:eukaryotic-like serine/threonine-protein kinase [Actinoplanes sp.]
MSSSPPLVVADRYRLVAPLGQGGMGRVWRATDVVLHREVAIKELVPPPGLTEDERREMRDRSLREARAIARLNNINVVRIFDVLRTDADPWIVMEYVPSRSLQDTLASDGPYPPVRAAEIGLGVLGALRAAHRAGVVHRDVKPGNVLIGEDGRVVLTDFGLATVPGDPNVTRTGLVLGSPAYIAPERARDGTAGPGADLWSLGATLYAAVEGASPFARSSAIATLAALATENPPPARNAGPLKAVLNGLLRKDPTHRINAEEAERLLLRAAGRRSRLAFPMSPTMRRPGIGRERPALPAASGSAPATPATPAAVPPIPVVPGPRPPVTEGRPVYAPGKATVGRRPAETPTRVEPPMAPPLDTTRVDTPPVPDHDKSNPFSGTPTADAPDTAAADGSPSPLNPSATMRGSRSAFESITAAEVAAHRKRPTTARAATPEAPATTPEPRTPPPPAAATPAQTPHQHPETDTPNPADRLIPVPAPRPPDRTPPKPATPDQPAADQAAADRPAADQAAADQAAADQAAADQAAADQAAADQAAADQAAADQAAADQAAADQAAADQLKAELAGAELAADLAARSTPATENAAAEAAAASRAGAENAEAALAEATAGKAESEALEGVGTGQPAATAPAEGTVAGQTPQAGTEAKPASPNFAEAGEVPPDNAGTGRTQAGPAETAMSTGAAKSNAAENDADQDDA